MKMLQIMLNGLSFIRKQGKTSWLIFTYPIVLILLVGVGLNLEAENELPIAVYGSDPAISVLEESAENILIIEVDSEEELRNAVRSKDAIIGIWFENSSYANTGLQENPSQNNSGGQIVFESASPRKEVNIYFDSTKPAVVSSLILLLDKALTEEKMEAGESLQAIQGSLAPRLVEIEQKQEELKEFSGRISQLKADLQSARSELASSQSQLLTYKEELQEYEEGLSDIDAYASRLNEYENEIIGLRTLLGEKEAQRDEVSQKLAAHITKIDQYQGDLQTAINYVSRARSLAPKPSELYTEINDAYYKLLYLKGDLQAARSDMVSMRSELNAIDFASINSGLTDTIQDIQSTRQDLLSFRQASKTRINGLIGDIDSTNSKISSAIEYIDSFVEELDGVESKVSETEALLGSMLGPLEEFSGKKPEELLPPEVHSEPVFGERKWIDLFFPTIIGIDILLASVLLPMIMQVRMREQGAELRLMKSRASSFSVILGQATAYYLISLLQLALISLVAIFVFGVQIPGIWEFAAILLVVPMAFNSIGVLLAQVVRTSSSAFMLSLLISIPMIFISGSIIPLEFMNPAVSFLGALTPLYVAVDFTEKVLFRASPGLAFLDSIYLGTATLFCTVASVALFYFRR